MNVDNPELIERLAAEYVLGTLRGRARQRFERWLAEYPAVRSAVWRWEARLGDLAAEVPQAEPPAEAWPAIERRLFSDATDKRGGWLWKLWGGFATAASLALALVLLQPQLTGELQPDHIAVVGDDNAPLWVIAADLESGRLSARAVNAEAAEVDRVFELWMLPSEGAPQSIGLLPVSGDEVQLDLPPGLLALLLQSKGLAISIEPPGGSPTGLPTGPIVHTASVVEI